MIIGVGKSRADDISTLFVQISSRSGQSFTPRAVRDPNHGMQPPITVTTPSDARVTPETKRPGGPFPDGAHRPGKRPTAGACAKPARGFGPILDLRWTFWTSIGTPLDFPWTGPA